MNDAELYCPATVRAASPEVDAGEIASSPVRQKMLSTELNCRPLFHIIWLRSHFFLTRWNHDKTRIMHRAPHDRAGLAGLHQLLPHAETSGTILPQHLPFAAG